MPHHNAKHFSPSLILASAALLIHIGVATAADSKGDIPQQAKESLAGTTKAHYALQVGKELSPTPDAQELARQLLLGSHPSHRASTETKLNAAGTIGETQTQKHPKQRRSFCWASIMCAPLRPAQLGRRADSLMLTPARSPIAACGHTNKADICEWFQIGLLFGIHSWPL